MGKGRGVGEPTMALLGGVGNGVGPPVLLPLQLPNEFRGVGGFEPASREAETLADQLELG